MARSRSLLISLLLVLVAAGAACVVPHDDAGVPSDPDDTGDTVELPWLRRDGEVLRSEDGRTFVVRGIDHAYDDSGLEQNRFELTDADLTVLRSWGVNSVRIRVRDGRAGLYPTVPAAPGFVDGLDELVDRINAHGMYVVLAFGGPENFLTLDRHPGDPLFEQAKFLPGNPAREVWLDYLDGMFDRYRDTPGVIGFDPINEDISFPPDLLDSTYMEAAHRDVLARLRDDDSRHVYFQQSSGWAYQGLSTAVGDDLGDPNRFYCVKMPVTPDFQARIAQQQAWAADAGTPLFVCEYALIDSQAPEETDLRLQDEALPAIDAAAVGSFRLGYAPGVRASMTDDGAETFWVDGFARPQPGFVGGTTTGFAWDRDADRFELTVEADGRGPTEVLVPPRLYTDGMVVTTGDGRRVEVDDPSSGGRTDHDGLGWDPARTLLSVPATEGELRVTITPLNRPTPIGPAPAEPSRPTEPWPDAPPPAEVGPAAFEAALVDSGEFTAPQSTCIVERLRTDLSSQQFGNIVRFGTLPPPYAGGQGGYDVVTGIGTAVHECAG